MEALAEFAPTTVPGTDVEVPGVRVRIAFPFDQLLGHLLTEDAGSSPLPAGTALATVPGDDADVFAQLEAEMVSDRLEQAQAQRRLETRETVARVLANAGPRGVDTVVDAADAQDMLEWLNRMYVTMRTIELTDAGAEPEVGQAQSASVFLGLDTEADADKSETVVPFGAPAYVFAALVDLLHQTLDDLPTS